MRVGHGIAKSLESLDLSPSSFAPTVSVVRSGGTLLEQAAMASGAPIFPASPYPSIPFCLRPTGPVPPPARTRLD